MKVHVFQHVPFEDIGSIRNWISKNDHKLSYTKFYEDWNLPHFDDFDFLIVMGGPMSTKDEDKFHWLRDEKKFIKSAIENGKYVLGICLGSQLIAEALGAKVFKNNFKEIGWFHITRNNTAPGNEFLPETLKTFHWHGDTFELPTNAKLLASSEVTKNQAFIFNDKVAGIQFHMEVTEESLNEMLTNGKNELMNDKFIQSGNEILESRNLIKLNNSYLENFLDKFLR